jgi:outer membrane protein
MRIFAAALVLASVSAPAVAQASQETLADAIDSAFANNPSLLAERRTRSVADETLEQARGAARPTLGATGSYGTQRTEVGQTFSIGGMTFPRDGNSQLATAGLEARLPIYQGGALGAQRRQAEAGVKASAGRLKAFEQSLILDVVTVFMDVRRAEQELAIRDNNVASLRQQVQAATDRFDVGEVTRTDVAQAQARFAGAEANLSAARANLAAARAAFEQIVGRPGVQLAEPPAAPAVPNGLDVAVAAAMQENPQVIAARAAAQAAEEGVGVARGALRPRVGIVANGGLQETYQDDSFRDTNVGVAAEVSIPIYTGGVASSRTREARLLAERARFDSMAAERAVTAQVTSAWHAVIAARQGITASQSRVEAAEIALEGAEQELAVGTRITLDVLDQERELLEAQLGLVDSRRTEYVAVHQLLAAVGRLRPEIIGR